MARHKNSDWTLPESGGLNWDHAMIAVLMDIRDELKDLNFIMRRRLNCPEFLAIPSRLDAIRKNTVKKKRRKPLRMAG